MFISCIINVMYVILFLVSMLLAFLRKLNQKKVLFIMILILVIFAIFRYGVGADYFAYKYLFSRYQASPFLELMSGVDEKELLFRLFGSVFRMFGVGYEVFVSVISVICLGFMYLVCKKYSKRPVLSLFLYYSIFYFTWVFSAYRQGLVLAIGTYILLRFQDKEDTWKFLLVTLFLSYIHISALALVVYYFIVRLKWSRRSLTIMLLVSIVIAIMPLDRIVASLSYLPLFDRVNYYVGIKNYDLSYAIKTIPRIIMALVAIYYYPYILKLTKNKNVPILFIFGMCLYLAFSSVEMLASRVSIYGFIFIILLIPEILGFIKRFKCEVYYACAVFMVVIFSGAYMIKGLNAMGREAEMSCETQAFEIVPYTSIFNKDICTFGSRHFKLTDGGEVGR